MTQSFKKLSFSLTILLLGNLLLVPSLLFAQNESEPNKSDVTENKLDEQESVDTGSGEESNDDSTPDNKAQTESGETDKVQDEPPKPRPTDAGDASMPIDSSESDPAEKDSPEEPDTSAADRVQDEPPKPKPIDAGEVSKANAADSAEQDSPEEPVKPAVDETEFLKNGSFETQTDGQPDDWQFAKRFRERGCVFEVDVDSPASGKVSGFVDTTEAEFDVKDGFALLNQFPDPVKLRGKRIRFRAAVRTDELADNGRAQLWLRVDRPRQKSRPVMGAFDNMADRPITSKEWQHYDIVADIDDDAERLTVGMLVFGSAKVWIDDASLTVVDDQTETTTKGNFGSVAANAPKQPFFVGWLWLALVALVLFAVSQARNSFIQRFALRFSVGYWVLYCFPTVIAGLTGSILSTLERFDVKVETATERLGKFVEGEKYYTGEVVQWVAANVLGINDKLILPNGSGDTTYAYVRVLICFFGALAIAIVWSSAYWRRSDQTWLRDGLRSYLRYVLALTMLGYGLHKAGLIMTQFAMDGVPNEYQLNRTYGESSPMGLLWTFMAASPAYTFFAGLGEVTGGLLLVFRRTATLGALVVFGVMLNIMMMNFCYDVPVKQYSFHLMIMAVFILLPDVPRLASVLLWNRTAEPSPLLIPPYTNAITIWIHRALKAIVVFCAFALPVYDHVKKEIEYEHPEAVESEHLLINRGFRWISEYPFNR